MLRFEVVWVVVWKAADDKSSNIQKKPKFPGTCFEIVDAGFAMKQLWDFMILLQPDLEAAATDFGRDLGSWEWDQHLLLPTLLVRASSKQSSRSFVISRCIIASSYYAASGHNLMLYFFSLLQEKISIILLYSYLIYNHFFRQPKMTVKMHSEATYLNGVTPYCLKNVSF